MSFARPVSRSPCLQCNSINDQQEPNVLRSSWLLAYGSKTRMERSLLKIVDMAGILVFSNMFYHCLTQNCSMIYFQTA